MTYHLQYYKIAKGHIAVHYTNGVFMGDILVGDDGFYAWWPLKWPTGGYIPAWVLRELADKLDDLNKEWYEQIQNDTTISKEQGT